MMHEHIDKFRDSIISVGLIPPDVIEPGKFHRFPGIGKRDGNTAGWCKLFDDGLGGSFGDWAAGFSENWQAPRKQPLTPNERAIFKRHVAEAKSQAEVERKAKHDEAAKQAATIWEQAKSAKDDHPYLQKKGIRSYGLRVYDGVLVIPMRDNKELQSLQFIGSDGDKRFLTGGRVNGCYFPIGKPDGVLCIVEGYATGASIHEATGCAVAVAFNAGNLLPVARILRTKFSNLRLIVCADDDVNTIGNPGLTKARVAAQAVGALLAVPDFGNNRPDSATDFNDLHQCNGLEAVRMSIRQAVVVTSDIVATTTLATAATEWPEAQPLDREAMQIEPFPLDMLPGKIGAAVREYQAYGQQPVALVASSALAVVSLAAQGLSDVARDEHLCGPLSLNFLIIAKSGERKTAADKALGAVLGDWEHKRAEVLREDIKRSRAALDAWTAEQEGLRTAIKTAVRKEPAEVTSLRQRLTDHELKKPREIVAPRLRYEDVNAQSLAFMLAAGHPSAALWSDEGGMVTGSHGMGKDSLLGFMAELNRLWDGGAIHHDRKQAQSIHMEGRRLTVSLMIQPLVLRELTQRCGGLTRGSGFLARFLVTAPISTMGIRAYQSPPSGMPCLAVFHERIRELLDRALPLDDQGRLKLPVLRLSAGAFGVWRDYHDAIECELKPLGEYATVCDFAAKSAENAARIAGCIHTFEGAQGAIPHETMQRAVVLARWYLREALRVLAVLDEPQAWIDARLLDAWLAEKGSQSPRDIQRLLLREKARRDAAIDLLTELGRARIEFDGKKRQIVVRNPSLKQLATATPATFATDEKGIMTSVAKVATVTVTEGEKHEIERGEL